MEFQTELAKRVDEDIEDVLATLPLVAANEQMVDHLYVQLVDLLLESIVVDLRAQLADGSANTEEYNERMAGLATQCRAIGLVPRT